MWFATRFVQRGSRREPRKPVLLNWAELYGEKWMPQNTTVQREADGLEKEHQSLEGDEEARSEGCNGCI